MARNKGKGRQKIEIKKIQNQTNIQVTFSKRCAGLMKKANELCTLTGAEIAFLAFSPRNKPYSFGNPSADSVIRDYQTGPPDPQTCSPVEKILQLRRQAKLAKLHDDLEVLQRKFEAEKERGAALDQMQDVYWWDASMENLNLDQLEKLNSALEEIHNEVKNEFKVQQEIPENSSFQLQNAFEAGHHVLYNNIGPFASSSSFRPTFGIDRRNSNENVDLHAQMTTGFGSHGGIPYNTINQGYASGF